MTRKTETMKVVGKSYTSVSEMVRDMSDAKFADDFDTYLAGRRLINSLVVLRCANDVSQADLAAKMGCGQPKVSKMESSADADLNFGDIVSYAGALKQTVHIVLSPSPTTGPDRIRFQIACIKHELDRLVNVAGDDKAIGDGVESFAIETIQKMVSMIEDSIDKLPHRSWENAPVTVEAEGDRGRRIPLDAPTQPRKSSKKAASTT